MWINERGFVAWDDELTSRRAAQRQGKGLLHIWNSGGFGPGALIIGPEGTVAVPASSGRIRKHPSVSGFVVTKLAAQRWQVIAFAADQAIAVYRNANRL